MKNVVATYEKAQEEDRLTTNNARKVEFLTTVRVFAEVFPAGANILDCAAGTGVYAFHLAQNGYRVTATDITPRHIDYINDELRNNSCAMKTAVVDASDLSCFEDSVFDIVLNMGPFYHIVDTELRAKCLSENLRVLKRGGLLATAYISRFAVFPYVATCDSQYLNAELANQLINTGVLRHDDPYCFWTDTYYASPAEMEECYVKNGLTIVDHFAQDGISPFLRHVIDTWDDEQFKIWCDYHYSVCREKTTLGASDHIMIIGRK